jgi:transcriptional regulator with XRE-family HTH domain
VASEPVASLRTREYDALRALLREAREAKRISQESLSQRLGRPITYIGKVETGTRRLDVIELMQICSELESDPVELIRRLRDQLAS